MVAVWGDTSSGRLPEPLEAMRVALSSRYRVEFDSVGVNLYRDGGDGVACDKGARRQQSQDVA